MIQFKRMFLTLPRVPHDLKCTSFTQRFGLVLLRR